jgi:hypothetical protein
MNRSFYHPVTIGADFIRKNVFDLVVPGTEVESIELLCKTITLTMPNTNAVQVPWIGGIMQVAGRLSQAFSFTAGFLVGEATNRDALTSIYKWRNQVFNHNTGAINLADNYKRTGHIVVYDVTGEKEQYKIECDGMWPVNIPDITLEVSDDGVLEVSAQFAADKIWIPTLNA